MQVAFAQLQVATLSKWQASELKDLEGENVFIGRYIAFMLPQLP